MGPILLATILTLLLMPTTGHAQVQPVSDEVAFGQALIPILDVMRSRQIASTCVVARPTASVREQSLVRHLRSAFPAAAIRECPDDARARALTMLPTPVDPERGVEELKIFGLLATVDSVVAIFERDGSIEILLAPTEGEAVVTTMGPTRRLPDSVAPSASSPTQSIARTPPGALGVPGAVPEASAARKKGKKARWVMFIASSVGTAVAGISAKQQDDRLASLLAEAASIPPSVSARDHFLRDVQPAIFDAEGSRNAQRNIAVALAVLTTATFVRLLMADGRRVPAFSVTPTVVRRGVGLQATVWF